MKRWFIRVTRTLCPFCVALFGLIAYDIIMPAGSTDEATVTGTSKHKKAKGADNYLVQARGRYTYNENITRALYERVKPGDTLHISLSRFFSEWKTLDVVRDGTLVFRATGKEIYIMGLFGLLFLISVCAFLPERILFAKNPLLFVLPIINLIAVVVWIRFILLWTGHIDKM